MVFKDEFVHVFWSFGKGIMTWSEKWKDYMVLWLFKGKYETYEVLIGNEG